MIQTSQSELERELAAARNLIAQLEKEKAPLVPYGTYVGLFVGAFIGLGLCQWLNP